MAKLNQDAKDRLRDAGVSQAAWARRYFGENKWYGDSCGCPDDRCIGHHHDERDECGCLDSLLRCHETRPNTLGYQHCQRDKGHSGPHRSQDGKKWEGDVVSRVALETNRKIGSR